MQRSVRVRLHRRLAVSSQRRRGEQRPLNPTMAMGGNTEGANSEQRAAATVWSLLRLHNVLRRCSEQCSANRRRVAARRTGGRPATVLHPRMRHGLCWPTRGRRRRHGVARRRRRRRGCGGRIRRWPAVRCPRGADRTVPIVVESVGVASVVGLASAAVVVVCCRLCATAVRRDISAGFAATSGRRRRRRRTVSRCGWWCHRSDRRHRQQAPRPLDVRVAAAASPVSNRSAA
jgi:hypothetical protein